MSLFSQKNPNQFKKLIGSQREEIFTYKFDTGFESKCFVRTYYGEEKDIVVFSPVDTKVFSNIIENFAHMACYYHDLDYKRTLFFEYNPDERRDEFCPFICIIPDNNEFFRLNNSAKFDKTINKEEFEKLIRCKYKSTFVSFLPSNDYMKNSHELKLCLIRDTLLNLRQVEGQYDLPINYSVEKDAKSVYAKQNEFIASMKFVEVKCLMNKFNIVNVNDKSGMEIIKPEFFYLIGKNFSNCFNEMSFNCFLDDSSNFYISLSELKLLIPKFFKKNIENSKNYYIEIDDNLYSEMIGIVEYLLCSTLKQPLFNTIHY